jgi:hypothetical protein
MRIEEREKRQERGERTNPRQLLADTPFETGNAAAPYEDIVNCGASILSFLITISSQFEDS